MLHFYLIPADQLVGIGQTRHETPFLEPIDGGERAREEDALYCGERDKTLPWVGRKDQHLINTQIQQITGKEF